MGTTIFSRMASVYVQTQPGRTPVYLGDCVDLDGIPNPRFGGIDLATCWNRRRDGFKVLGKTKSAPGPIEYTLTEMLQTSASYVRTLGCPFYLYALFATCGDAGVFSNWDVAGIVAQNDIKEDNLKDVYKHTEDGNVSVEVALSGIPPRYDPLPLVASREDTTETRALNAIANCGNLFCGDNCAVQTIPCDNWYAAGDGAGGSKANVLKSADAGTTWVSTAAQPFAVAQNIAAMVCFEMGRGQNRLLAYRENVAGAHTAVAYSDTGGATWTTIELNTTDGEGGTGPKSLIALDWQHIWAVTSGGNVYFSSDGGETYVDQNASGASGATRLNAVSFVDEKIGYAVGNTDTIIGTIDGGAHWVAETATGTGDGLLAVTTFSQYRLIVGTNNATAGGSLWMSFDGTATWEEKIFVGHASEQVKDMDFWNECVGLILTDEPTSVSDKSSIHQTINGGDAWREIPDMPDNSGLNAVIMCGINEAIAVGELQGGTPVILHISAG